MNWIKSSKCYQNECVEVSFHRSSKCLDGNCVEVATVGDVEPTVGVRNSRIPGEVVWFDTSEWRTFLEGVKAGDFDL